MVYNHWNNHHNFIKPGDQRWWVQFLIPAVLAVFCKGVIVRRGTSGLWKKYIDLGSYSAPPTSNYLQKNAYLWKVGEGRIKNLHRSWELVCENGHEEWWIGCKKQIWPIVMPISITSCYFQLTTAKVKYTNNISINTQSVPSGKIFEMVLSRMIPN